MKLDPPDPTRWGCSVPSSGSNSYTLDASQNLAEAIKKAKAGDVINLASGNYGAVSVNGPRFTSFVTIQAAPGAQAVLTFLHVNSASHMIFKNLKIQSQATADKQYQKLVLVQAGNSGNASDNIVFEGNDISSVDDSAAWSLADWLAHGQWTGLTVDGGADSNGAQSFVSCISVLHNKIHDVRIGVSIGAIKTLFQGNTIDRFGDDALDYAASDIVIRDNTITNAINIGDGNHPDAMQGQIGRSKRYSNILIDGNTVIRQTISGLKFSGPLQGIDAFDSDWYNITVTHNKVTTDSYHGISYASIHTANISNNIVHFDGSPSGKFTWLMVSAKTHAGSTSDHVLVKDNVVDRLSIQIPAVPESVIAEHNTCSQQLAYQDEKGKAFWQSKPGVYNVGSETGNLVGN